MRKLFFIILIFFVTKSDAQVVSTFAGTPSSSGNLNGNGTSARFQNPSGIAIDPSGNLYVADGGNNIIRKISPNGIVSTIAGSGAASSVDGLASQASFNIPFGICLDSYGNIYITEFAGNKIRKISTNGVVSTIAGTGSNGFVDGIALNASFSGPTSLAINSNNEIFVTDRTNNAIRKISPSGQVSTFSGGVFGGLDGPIQNATFSWPTDIIISTNGDIYVTEAYGRRVRKITSSGIVSTVAGSLLGLAGNLDGNGTNALFGGPMGIAFDQANNMYICDEINQSVRKVNQNNDVSLFAGSNNGAMGSINGVGNSARFYNPYRLVYNNNTNEIFLTEYWNHTIRKISLTSPCNLTANAGPDRDCVCTNSSCFIGTPAVNGNTYLWSSNPVGFTSTNAQENVPPLVSTTYYLTVTNTATNCVARDTVKINVLPCPVIANKDTTSITSVCSETGFENGQQLNWADWHAGYGNISSNSTSLDLLSGNYYFWWGIKNNEHTTTDIENQTAACSNYTSCNSALTIPASDFLQVNQNHHVVVGSGADPIIPIINKTHAGSSYSLKLGNSGSNNGFEFVEKKFVVTAATNKFSFWYAYVMSNPQHGLGADQYFGVDVFKATGSTITKLTNVPTTGVNVNVGSGTYYAGSSDLFSDSYARNKFCDATVAISGGIKYKDWSYVNLDLSNQIGNTIVIRIWTRDCSHCGDFAYAYLDDFCSEVDNTNPTGSMSITSQSQCGLSGTICINYTLPNNGTTVGTAYTTLKVYQNGNTTPVYNLFVGNIGSSQPNPYCINLNTIPSSIFASGSTHFDFEVNSQFKIGTTTVFSQSIGSPGVGINAGANNDYQINCPESCTPCTLQATLTKPNNGGTTTLTSDTTNLECGKNYDFNQPTLTCNPTNNAMVIKQVKVIDALGNTPAWASSFTGTGMLNIPSNTTGVFYVKYVRGTATTRCDSISYPIKVTCSPCTSKCFPIITVTGASPNLLLSAGSYNGTVMCGKNYTFNVNLNCTPANAAYQIKAVKVVEASSLTTPSWATSFIASNGTTPLTVPPTGTGNYSIKFFYGIQNTICDSVECKIFVNNSCPKVCPCSSITFATPKQAINNQAFQDYAGGTVTVTCGSQNKFYVSPIFPSNCTNVKVTAELRDANSVVVSPPNVGNDYMNPLVYTFSNSHNTSYTLTYKLNTGDTVCKTITIPIVTECLPPTCPTCTGSVTYEDALGVHNFSTSANSLACGKTYELSADNFKCTIPFSSTDFLPIVKNSSGISMPWIIGGDDLNIPPNTQGSYTFIVKWKNPATGLYCDSVIYPLQITCVPPCNLTANAGPDKLICPPQSITIGSPSTSGNTYSWSSIPTGFTSTLANPSVSPSVATTYYLTVTNTNTQCVAKDTVVISINNNCNPTPTCITCSTKVATTSTVSLTSNTNLSATNLVQSFSFTGLPANITEVRATVTNVKLFAVDENGKIKEECLSCKNEARTWASIINGSGITGVTPKININGVETAAPVTLAPDINARNITWKNTAAFSINSPVELSFLLPQKSTLPCCTRKATICIKFVFRNDKCEECVATKCFDVEIK